MWLHLAGRSGVKLPNAGRAHVDRAKVTDYLLSATHPIGAAKARFFVSFGFSSDDWGTLADALRSHARQGDATSVRESPYGTRYDVDGPLDTPSRRSPRIRTVWQIDTGSMAPRLLTAYPIQRP